MKAILAKIRFSVFRALALWVGTATAHHLKRRVIGAAVLAWEAGRLLQGASSDPLGNWRNLHPLTDLARVRIVQKGEGISLAIVDGTILRSYDDVNWKRVDTEFSVRDIAFVSGRWI